MTQSSREYRPKHKFSPRQTEFVEQVFELAKAYTDDQVFASGMAIDPENPDVYVVKIEIFLDRVQVGTDGPEGTN